MKNKFLSHTVKIRVNKKWPDPYEGQRGEVVCVVREGRGKQYIVQFKKEWSFFNGKQLKIDE